MAKKQSKPTNTVKETKPEYRAVDVFKDPSESLIGKIVIGLIIFGTIAGVFIGAILAVIEYFS